MALSYPLALPAVPLYCRYFDFEIPGQRGATRGGGTPGIDSGSARFRADYETPVLYGVEFRLMTAWISAVRKVKASVLAWDTRSRYPYFYQGVGWTGLTRAVGGTAFDGTCTLASVGSDGYTLGLSGLPNGFKLGPGDPLSLPYDTSRIYYGRVGPISTVTAGSGGTASITVDPLVPLGVATTVTVTLDKPAFWGHVSPESIKAARDDNFGTFAFCVEQSLDKSA